MKLEFQKYFRPILLLRSAIIDKYEREVGSAIIPIHIMH